MAERWDLIHGDCIDLCRDLEDESIDYSIFSPPFASLYTYSDDPRDMGNCVDRHEFFEHFSFLVPELFRATKPGRLLSFHCMLLPILKSVEGHIGLHDLRGDLIRAFVDRGWILHSEVCIWKCPVTQQQRTKALGLLYKQLMKDSGMSRTGLADYLITVRKPGTNAEAISHTKEDFPLPLWQRHASPVWFDIDATDTLQHFSARGGNDEKHICPLQLEVIRRALKLWSNPDDLVLSPFAGIGSEGYVALKEGRRFIGFELKESYVKVARENLGAAVSQLLLVE